MKIKKWQQLTEHKWPLPGLADDGTKEEVLELVLPRGEPPPSPWVKHSRAKLGFGGGGGWPQNNVCIILKIINFLQMFCKLPCSGARAIVLSKSLGVVLDIHLLFPNAIQPFFPPGFYFFFLNSLSFLKLAAISLSLKSAVASASAVPR